MRYVSEEMSGALISESLAFEAVRRALIAASDDAVVFPVLEAHGSDPANTYAIKSSADGALAGLKIGSYWPGNESFGLPRHSSVILLIDQGVGRVGAVVEASRLNAFRTAAADAVAADALSRTGASILAVFGAGHQAAFEIGAVSRVRDLREVLVVARDPTKAKRFVADLRADGVPAVQASPEEACRAADIIVTVTPARAPLFDADWVEPGTHVVSMGSDATGKQELPPRLFERASLFCDLPSQSRVIGEFQHAPESATLTPVGAVLSGRCPGRTSDEEITVFDSSGLSVQDLYVARAILEKVDSNA